MAVLLLMLVPKVLVLVLLVLMPAPGATADAVTATGKVYYCSSRESGWDAAGVRTGQSSGQVPPLAPLAPPCGAHSVCPRQLSESRRQPTVERCCIVDGNRSQGVGWLGVAGLGCLGAGGGGVGGGGGELVQVSE